MSFGGGKTTKNYGTQFHFIIMNNQNSEKAIFRDERGNLPLLSQTFAMYLAAVRIIKIQHESSPATASSAEHQCEVPVVAAEANNEAPFQGNQNNPYNRGIRGNRVKRDFCQKSKESSVF